MIQADPVKPFNLVIYFKKFVMFGPSSYRWLQDKVPILQVLHQHEKIVA